MESFRIIRKKELKNILGLSDATIYRLEKKGEFPKRLKISDGLVGWLYDDIQSWVNAKK